MLDLPPPYSLVTLKVGGDAFAHAQAIAATEGAGTLVWVPGGSVVDVAVVLEPIEILEVARQVAFAGLIAAADALAVDAPPEKPIGFRWPDVLLFDGGEIGRVRLAWADEEVPEWVVLGLSLRAEEDGFIDFESGVYVENFARYLMLALDEWLVSGPAAVVARFRRRCVDAP
jgi:hypothetical protein